MVRMHCPVFASNFQNIKQYSPALHKFQYGQCHTVAGRASYRSEEAVGTDKRPGGVRSSVLLELLDRPSGQAARATVPMNLKWVVKAPMPGVQ